MSALTHCRNLLLAAVLILPVALTSAEYADVIINNRAESEGLPPVVFPHWFHRIRYQCSVCHVELAMQMKAGANNISMDKISDGQYCGACHNGVIAWSAENCDLCHSGRAGLETGIRGGHSTGGPGIY